MLPITTVFDNARFQRDLNAYAGQAVFAASVAINKTLEQKQAQLRAHIASKLTIRNAKARRTFADVILFGRNERADLRRQPLVGRILVVGGNQEARTNIFRRFGQMVIRQDEGGVITSRALYRTQRREFAPQGFIIPAPGLRTATKAMPQRFYPTALGLSDLPLRRDDLNGLGLQYRGGRKKRGGFRKGTRFFFVKEGVGIFMREQRAVRSAPQKAIRMPSASRGTMDKNSEYDAIWFFRRQIRLPKRLRIEETFTGGLAERFQFNYEQALANALRTAR